MKSKEKPEELRRLGLHISVIYHMNDSEVSENQRIEKLKAFWEAVDVDYSMNDRVTEQRTQDLVKALTINTEFYHGVASQVSKLFPNKNITVCKEAMRLKANTERENAGFPYSAVKKRKSK